ncbi:MAG: VWA domain-containing protein [Acidobacteriota bacterium]
MPVILNAAVLRKSFFRSTAVFCMFSLVPASPQDSEPVFRTGANLVLMDVSVTDAKGVPVGELKRGQFVLKEDGRQREISRFEERPANVSLALVVDYSGSMRPRLDALSRGVQALVGSFHEGDQAELIVFNEDVTTLRGFADGAAAQSWNGSLRRQPPTGSTALYDAVIKASLSLDASEHERRVLIVLSDGQDTASSQSLNQAVDTLRSSNRLVYTVGLFTPGDMDTDAHALRKLAEATGGLAVFDPDGQSLPATFTRIMRDLRARYLLGFYAADATAGKEEIRKLSLSVRDPNGKSLKVVSRREYRIAPVNPPSPAPQSGPAPSPGKRKGSK